MLILGCINQNTMQSNPAKSVVNYCDHKAWIHRFPLTVKSHLFLWWLWRVLISVQLVALSAGRGCWARLGSVLAAQLASSQGLQSCAAPPTYQRAVWITTPHLMASCHMMNIIIHNTSGATHSVSLHRVLPCWFHCRNPPPCELLNPSKQIVLGNMGKYKSIKIK